MNRRTHRQLIHNIGAHLTELRALDPIARITAIGDAVDDGCGSPTTDTGPVTGGTTTSPTEKLATRPDRALNDLNQLRQHLNTIEANLAIVLAILRRWPTRMPTRADDRTNTDRIDNDACYVCGELKTRNIHAPGGRIVVMCNADAESWRRRSQALTADGHTPTARSFADWRDERRNRTVHAVARPESAPTLGETG